MNETFDLEEIIWIGEEDIDIVTDNVKRSGTLIYEWDEDPEETRDPYTRCEMYEFKEMRIEMLYIEGDEYPSDIRASIVVGHQIDGKIEYIVPEKELRPTLDSHTEVTDPSSPFIRKKYLELLNYSDTDQNRLSKRNSRNMME